MNKEDVFFPFDEIREIQDSLISAVHDAVKKKENLIVHAPTGLGKTAASLGPALKEAEKNGLTVFFLTSRHTQHRIAVETIREISKKYNIKIPVVDIIGKKWMCLQPAVNILSSGEFSEYCKSAREGNKCEFFNNMKKAGKESSAVKSAVSDIEENSPLEVQDAIKKCGEEKVCPYEVSMILSKKAKVIVADYYYIFNPAIMLPFFLKSKKELSESIIIVDEAHNLPKRIRDMLGKKLSTLTINQARKEAKELKDEDCNPILDELQSALLELIEMDEERVVKKNEFRVDKKEEIIEMFEGLGEITISKSKRSYLMGIANFLESYSDDEGFVNIIRHLKTHKGERIELAHSCLDPSIASKAVFDNAYCSILMSGTLTPVKMYKDILGINAKELELASPFPKKNKLNLIIPDTTTKYSERSSEQFSNIAKTLSKVCNAVPGNTAVFFPSYFIRDQVYKLFSELSAKTVFSEFSGMTKEEKEELLDKFKSYKNSGAVLLGVASGSFGEGIDLPGDFLKCVVIVGLPLNKPDIETQELINYYDRKYSKGWDYGYVLPAVSKVFQNAGRCIRSETDKGIIVFMDKRYMWENYRKCFSEDVEATMNYEKRIADFFKKHS